MKRLSLLVLVLSFSSMAFASSWTIDFEGYPAYTQITSQYSADDASFDNALQLVAPGYDYFDYPPTSGSGVITNDPNDPIEVDFSIGMYGVSGYYVDPDGVTVTAFDSLGNPLDVFNGAAVIDSDLHFSVSSTTPIAYVQISDVGGNADAETVDDLSYETPEPGTLLLMGSGILGLAGFARRKFAR